MKGQVFSLIAILISSLFILLFSGLARIPLDDDVENSRAELFTVSDYIANMESYFETSVDAVGYKVLNYSDGYIRSRDGAVFFDDYEDFFRRCFLYGEFIDPEFLPATVYSDCGGTNISFILYFESLLANADETYNLNSYFDNISVAVGQEEPYSIDVNVTARIVITRDGSFTWNQLFRTSRRIDVYDMVDPATLGTDHIRRFSYPTNARSFSVQQFEGDLEELAYYIENQYYFQDQTSPSFVARMQGERADSFTTYTDPLGISSILNATNITGDSLYQENISVMAHHYDANLPTADCTQLRRIDDFNISHNLIFRIDTLTESLGLDSENFLSVCGCCDESGCNPVCG